MQKLEIRNIVKSYGNNKVIDELSFFVNDGEFCVLLGPSGCGKSTMLRIIAGLESQDSGKIFLNENEISKLSPRERNIAMVFQNYALYPHMTAFANIAFPLTMRKENKTTINEKVIETAKLLNIEGLLERKPRQLSGGERQRVALGRAIVRNPELFLFDEPLSNLDARLRTKMRREISSIHGKLRSTSIYVTHDQLEAMTMADKIILINNGKIQQTGTPGELYNNPENIFTAQFIGTPEINLIEGKIERKDGKFILKRGSFSLALGSKDIIKKFENEMVTIGIRAESFSADRGSIKGRIENIENAGSQIIAYVKPEGIDKTMAVRLERNIQYTAGDNISLDVNRDEIHFFINGKRAF